MKTIRGIMTRSYPFFLVSIVSSMAVSCAAAKEAVHGDDKLVVADAGSDAAPAAPNGPTGACEPPAIDRFKELLIVDPTVVTDPVRTKAGGAWSFRHLFEQMAPEGANVSDFIQTWLFEWKLTTLNGFPVAPKGAGVDRVLAAWPLAADGKLDLDQAPFQLLAISNRMDLRDKAKTDSAGEGRFVFGFLEGGQPSSFTLILEYVLPVDDARTINTWASGFHQLGALPLGEAYNQALEVQTRLFTERNAAPAKPNGCAIGQVRTNEVSLGDPWELREFRLIDDGSLRMSTTLQCPDQSFNHGNPDLAKFIQDHADEVRRGTHVVPTTMLGAVAPETPAGKWDIPAVSEELRHAFALQTCNGCHAAETESIGGFFHVSPFGEGPAKLSPFLNSPTHPEADELARRAGELALLICGVSQDHNPATAGPGNTPVVGK